MLIAVDLDGTLFGRDAQVSARTIDSLNLAVKAGYSIVAVTGRSWRTCIERLKPASMIEYVVCSNGAYAYDVEQAKVRWSRPLDAVACVDAMRKIRAEFPEVGFGWESETGFSYEKAFIRQVDDPKTLEQSAKGGVPGQSEMYKLLIRLPKMQVEQFAQLITGLVGDAMEVSTSGAPFLDATAPTVNKAVGLATAAEHFNVDAQDVIAFGDNLNDLPMLKWAGTAVAMGNAHPEVLSVADAMTVSNRRDGVAVYIDKMLGSL